MADGGLSAALIKDNQPAGGQLQAAEIIIQLLQALCQRVSVAIAPDFEFHRLAEGYGSRPAQLVHAFFNLVEQHFQQLHGGADYAAQLAITPNYLNEVVKEQTARTAGAIIADRLMIEAKRLAYFSDLASQEIAARLGFQDPAYFSRFFKQQSGQTLSHFRRTIRKKYNSPQR